MDDTKIPNKKKSSSPAKMAVIDILLIVVSLGIYMLFDLVIPQKISTDLSKTSSFVSVSQLTSVQADTIENIVSPTAIAEVSVTPSPTVASDASDTSSDASADVSTKEAVVTSDTEDWGVKFADKFTDGEVITTDSTYMSENVNITLTSVQSGGVTYYVEDIYIRSIEYLRTAFADDTYGRSITDWVLNMAEDNNAIAAINGDYYGTGSSSVVIRNGILYRSSVSGDVCVLYSDGTMVIYSEDEFDADEAMASGAWQAWSFGPSLLSDNGEALTNFASGHISNINPRTVIGYYEPGHYCFVVVDGRQDGYSVGMTLKTLASLMEDMGLSVAYNLDGGKSSVMTFEGEIADQPASGGRQVSDIVFISE